MATFWVSTAGTNTASGTNLANAKKTLSSALTAASQGDTINMVNDGTHSGTATAPYLWSGWIGTDFDTDPGVHIRGCDTIGASAMCTVAFTATDKEWFEITYQANYVWVEGMRFDYSSLLNANVSGMIPVQLRGNTGYIRLNDCECVMSTNTGSAVDFGASTQVPDFPSYNGASAAKAGELELYNNVYVNARMMTLHLSTALSRVHHNIIIVDGKNQPATTFPIHAGSGSASMYRLYKNTIVHRMWDGEELAHPAVSLGSVNNTTKFAHYDNLLYTETGSTAASKVAAFRFGGFSGATQITSANTIGNNYMALGPHAAADSTDWDTSTLTGLYSYQFNPTWRGGGANAGTALNSGDVFNRTSTLGSVFNDITSSYTWTPGSYSHDLPYDMRPIVGRTAASDGGVVGAISDAVNADPVVIPSTHTATSGVLKTVNSTNGVLAGSSDPDSDTLTATVVLDVAHGSLTLNTTDGSFEYTPNITYTGTDSFEFKAWDGTTFSNVSTATLNVSNQTPTVSPRSYSTRENITLSITAADGMLAGATDPDVGQTLSITSVVAPDNGTLVSYNITTGSFVYRPDAFFAGLDSFTYKVTDGNTLTAATTAAIQVLTAASSSITNLIDTAPFFRPSLFVETEFRTKWKKNRKKALNESNYTDGKEWNESTSRSLVLTPSATTTITLGGVASAKYIILETDYPIEVSIDGTDKYWPVSKVVAVALTEFASIHLHSLSTTNAQVILTVVD